MKLSPKNHQTYMASFRLAAEQKLYEYFGDLRSLDLRKARADQGGLLRYPNLASLRLEPQGLVDYNKTSVSSSQIRAVKEMLAFGRHFTEHTLGGAGTRLNRSAQKVRFGQKYFITPREIEKELDIEPVGLMNLSLGERHMLQLSFEIRCLAEEMGEKWPETLARQKMLIVASDEKMACGQATCEEGIIASFIKRDFFGFDPRNIMFVASQSYPGLELRGGELKEDMAHRRLHNHGIVRTQNCMEDVHYTVDSCGCKTPAPFGAYRTALTQMSNMGSYCVEDLELLIAPIDYKAVAIATRLALQGYRMVMEIVAQKPAEKAQKGGLLAFDPCLPDPLSSKPGRLVVVESFQLGLPPEKLEDGLRENPAFRAAIQRHRLLNRNVTQFPRPADSFAAVAKAGLPPHLEIFTHDDGEVRIYNLSAQGDANFIVPTAFVVRRGSLQSLKQRNELSDAYRQFRRQEEKKGFRAFAANFYSAQRTV